jgi:MFS family permease
VDGLAVAGGTARRMISSLYQRNYRLFFFGQLVSVIGTWMESVAQSFLVLDLTHSGTALGLTLAARFGPMLAFGMFGGVIADRLDKRRVLYVTQTLSGVISAVFAVLVASGSMHMWIVYLLSVILGFVNVFDSPARQSFISELVQADDLPNAVTLNSVAMNIARVLGGAVGGTIAGLLGLAVCFAVNAASFAAVLISLALMRVGELFPAHRVERERGQVTAGLKYVAGSRALLVPMVMIAVIGTLAWEFQVTMPLMASNVFHRGPAGYGLMSAVMGVGAIIGGVVATARRKPGGLALAALGWGVSISAAAVAPSLPLELVALLFVGYGSLTFNSYAKTELQLASVPEMRGRVMSLWALAWMGSTPIGGPIVGWIGQEAGARWALLIGGVTCVACGLWALPGIGRRVRGLGRVGSVPSAPVPLQLPRESGPRELVPAAEEAEPISAG